MPIMPLPDPRDIDAHIDELGDATTPAQFTHLLTAIAGLAAGQSACRDLVFQAATEHNPMHVRARLTWKDRQQRDESCVLTLTREADGRLTLLLSGHTYDEKPAPDNANGFVRDLVRDPARGQDTPLTVHWLGSSPNYSGGWVDDGYEIRGCTSFASANELAYWCRELAQKYAMQRETLQHSSAAEAQAVQRVLGLRFVA